MSEGKFLLCMAVLSIAVIGNAFSADSKTKAAARVAVAQALAEVADTQPTLNANAQAPENVVDQAELDRLRETAESQAHEIERYKADFVPRPPTLIQETVKYAGLEPMRLSFPAGAAIHSEVMPAQLIVRVWEKGCTACNRLKHDCKTTLAPRGWKIGNTADCQIFFCLSTDPTESVPTIILEQNGIEIKRWVGYTDPSLLSRELRTAWDTAETPRHAVAMASGSAGTIKARAQAQMAVDTLDKYVGQGKSIHWVWSRNGSPALNLWARGEWTAVDIFGTDGRIKLTCPDAKNLPIKEFEFTYEIVGSDFILDAGPIRLVGLADQMSPHPDNVYGATPAGIIGIDDALFMWSVISMMRDIISVLQPTCDLMLPSQIVADITLNGNVITTAFDRAPSVRFVMLFTFNLVAKQVLLSPTNAHIDLGGSRFVKSRDFDVQ